MVAAFLPSEGEPEDHPHTLSKAEKITSGNKPSVLLIGLICPQEVRIALMIYVPSPWGRKESDVSEVT